MGMGTALGGGAALATGAVLLSKMFGHKVGHPLFPD